MKKLLKIFLILNIFTNPLKTNAMDNFMAPQAPRVYSMEINSDDITPLENVETKILSATVEVNAIHRKGKNKYNYDNTYTKIRRGEFIAKNASTLGENGKRERLFSDVYNPKSIKSGFKGSNTVNVNNIRNDLSVMDKTISQQGKKALNLDQSAYYAFAKMMDLHSRDLNLQGDALNNVPVPKYHHNNSLQSIPYNIGKALGSNAKRFEPDTEREKIIRPAIR